MAHKKRDDTGQTDLPAGLSRPALSALTEAGYTNLKQLAKVTEADLLRLHGMGPKSIPLLREALRARGLDFARPAAGETKQRGDARSRSRRDARE